MIRKFSLFLSIIFLVVQGVHAAGTIPRIEASLDKDRIQVGEETTLTIEVTWEGEASEFEFLFPDRPDCHRVTVTGSAQKSTAYRSEGRLHQIRQYFFKLRGEEKGKGKVGYVRLLYRRRGGEKEHSLRSEPREIVVTSRLANIFRTLGKALLLMVVGVLVIVLIAGYIRWTVKRYQKKSSEMIADYVKDLEDESIRELGLARKLKVEGEIEDYFNQIWKVLSAYLEKRYSIKISDRDWEEVLDRVNQSIIDVPSRAQLKEILKILERSRFGIYSPESQDLDSILKRVVSFFESQRERRGR